MDRLVKEEADRMHAQAEARKQKENLAKTRLNQEVMQSLQSQLIEKGNIIELILKINIEN